MAQSLDRQPYTVVLDNARPHLDEDLNIPENFTIKFLPPYTPILNPIENFFFLF